MRDPFPTVSEGAISDWVGSRSFQRGRNYFKSGAILDPRLQGNTLKAWCQGSRPQPYHLWVVCGTEGIKEANCSCPVGGGGRCKHVAALLLVWSDQPDSFREVEELDTNLERYSKSELIALVKQVVKAHPTLEALLEVVPPEDGRSSPLVDPESYRRQAGFAFRTSFDDWGWGGAGVIDVVLGSGDNFLAKSDYANAGIVYQAVAQAVFENFEMVHDEYAEYASEVLYEVVNRCVQGLGNCLANGDGDTAAREKALQALLEIFRLDFYYGDSAGEDAADLILKHATGDEKRVVAGWVRTAMLAVTGRYNSYQRRAYGSILLDLEADHLDDDAYLEICRESDLLDNLVDRLLTLERLDEALAEAGQAEDLDLLTLAELFSAHDHGRRLEPLVAKRIETTHINGLVVWLKNQHAERGGLAEALVLAKRLLDQRPGLAKYQDVRELSQRLGVWQATRPELLAEWVATQQYGLLTDIYLDEGEIDLALKSVYQPSWGFYYGQWMRVAEAAAETRPQAAAELYRKQAEKLIEARGREKYQEACIYLARMRDLYRQMSQESTWTDFMVELRERHHRLSALQDELNKAGL